MSNRDDLHERLRAAAGAPPDPDEALEALRGRIGRHARWRAVLATVAAVAVVAGGIALFGRATDRDVTVVAEPPAGEPVEPDEAGDGSGIRWRAEGIGMGAWVADGGPVMVASEDTVFVAEGYGPDAGRTEPTGRVTALDRASGAERWQTELGGPSFVQGVTGSTLVASTQWDRVVGIDVADGSLRWELSLGQLGLEGYGASAAAVGESMVAVAVATGPSSSAPAVVVGIDPDDGRVLWRTTLSDDAGGEFWTHPVVADGAALFVSTPGYPEDGPESVVHAIDLVDGAIRWEAGVGTATGRDVVVTDGRVHVPALPQLVTLDLATGERRWSHVGVAAAAIGGELWAWAADGGLTVIDPGTGDVVRRGEVAMGPVGSADRILDLGQGRVGMAGETGIAVVDNGGQPASAQRWTARAGQPPVLVGDTLVIATEDETVTGYDAADLRSGPDGG